MDIKTSKISNQQQRQFVLPSIQDIYDLSTDQLHEILQKLQTSSNIYPELKQQFRETIATQIQQRKTLEFFSQMLKFDNPYLKKIDNFKDQFSKLVGERLEHQKIPVSSKQSNRQFTSRTENVYNDNLNNHYDNETEKSTILSSNQRNQTDVSFKHSTIQKTINKQRLNNTSGVDKGRESKKDSGLTASNYSFNPSITSQSELQNDQKSRCSEKKMGIVRTTKQKKKAANDLMNQLLLKNRQIGDCILNRGTGSPQQSNNSIKKQIYSRLSSNKPAFPPNSHKQIKIPKPTQISSQKHMPHTGQKKKQQQIRKQMVDKKKHNKKLPPIKNTNQKWVQMVKKEQQEKILKEKRRLEAEQHREKMIHEAKLQKIQSQDKIGFKKVEIIEEQIEGQTNTSPEILSTKYESVKKSQQKKQEDKIQQKVPNESKQRINQQVIEQSINTQRQDNIPKNRSSNKIESQIIDKISNKDNKNQYSQPNQRQKEQKQKQQTTRQLENNSQKQQAKQQIYYSQQQKQSSSKNQQRPENSLKKLEQQNTHQKETINKNIVSMQANKFQEQFEKINNSINLQKIKNDTQNSMKNLHSITINNTLQENNSHLIDQKQRQQQKKRLAEPKRYYNEEYWINIREQAQKNIQRFKYQKQIENITKQKQSKVSSQKQPNNSQQSRILDDDSQQEISQPKNQQLKQDDIKQATGANFLKNKQANKKTKIQIPKVIKPTHPKPDFNYLEIFPSFNHLFSIMYTKSSTQASTQLPSVMKDIAFVFSKYMDKMNKGSTFRPTLFLPFDAPSSSGGMSDPKNLLLHTENTYVDLRTMVKRLEIFNQNIHGHFQRNNEDSKATRFYRVIKTKEQVYDIITSSFLRRVGWKELPHGHSLKTSWNLFWSWAKPDIDLGRLLTIQKINHFPFNKNLSRKDLLHKNLDMFRKQYKVSMPFLPLTFILPKEFSQFCAKFHQAEILSPLNYWIMKPIGKSRGRGIKVISNLAELSYTDNIVVQKYITNPMLVEGYKFDMRVYVLVTSLYPLEVFLYKEGFARFSTEKFNLDPSHMKNNYVHLTNFSINRHNQDAQYDKAAQMCFRSGSKISFKQLKEKLTRMNHSWSKIWNQVKEIIIKSLLACSLHVPVYPSAFELFGYDIMIDTQQQCHLIQINASPSLQRAYMLDEVIKQALIDDILDIVNPPQFDKGELLNVINERLGSNPKYRFTAEDDLIDLARILKYQPIRKLGEVPEKLGLFQMIAPSSLSEQVQKHIKSRPQINYMHNID